MTPLKRRLDWDFLQALVKMNTAANTMLPGSMPFSARGQGQDRGKPKTDLVYLASFDNSVLRGTLMTTKRKQINGVNY